MQSRKILWPGVSLVFLFLSCKKDSTLQGGSNIPPGNPPTNPPPSGVTLTGINPSSGPMATVVTIDGSHFDSIPGKDSVWFNNNLAVVQKATATQLTVAVPKTAGTGTVTVKVGGALVTGPVFTYVYTAMVSTVAGNGTPGMSNANGLSAEFSSPASVALNPGGNTLYVADAGNNSIRGMTTGAQAGGQYPGPAGNVTAYSGSTTAGYVDGTVSAARFNMPYGVATDATGNIYVADDGNSAIRKITPAGVVSTLAGGVSGFADGTGTAAKFYQPAALALDSAGNIYVSDLGNQRIRKVTPAGVVTTLAGTNSLGFSDGTGSAAKFTNPSGLCIDPQGNVYVADIGNNRIRKITPAGMVTTFAGTGTAGTLDGAASSAQFYGPSAVTMDAKGNLFVTDANNSSIRMITPSGMVSTLCGKPQFAGFRDGAGSEAYFRRPMGITIDAKGALYVADNQNNSIRKITME